jgi:hypothetical protein
MQITDKSQPNPDIIGTQPMKDTATATATATVTKKEPEEMDNDDYLDKYVRTLSAASSVSNPLNNSRGNFCTCKSVNNNNLVCCKPGIQVSVYDFQKLPTPGNIYRVDDNHELVALKFIPGEVYQADDVGNLVPIGLFNYHFNAGPNNLPN